ncbi:single-stranded DNA-binding protein [uncultured Paracoccus sp.]|uniref:single-stranded DNA-binding protein n=1 Tax=uncultured Paracoccus sp. TaxID=189685 RepID=UPI00263817D9|nr:single-stranded DNA-binding protein [uncultured Paracoccus sp.]
MFYTFAEFQIQGYVGRKVELGNGKVLKVSIAATDSWKDKESGEPRERTDWNTVTLFERSTAGFSWLKENLQPGDLVHVRGRIAEGKYDKNGQAVYETALTADRFAVVPVGKAE